MTGGKRRQQGDRKFIDVVTTFLWFVYGAQERVGASAVKRGLRYSQVFLPAFPLLESVLLRTSLLRPKC
jgi:hypothetical protein